MLRPTAGGRVSDSNANARCQKCLQTGHWTFDCTGARKYRTRPSRTALLINPQLRLPESLLEGVDPTTEPIIVNSSVELVAYDAEVHSEDHDSADVSQAEESDANELPNEDSDNSSIIDSDSDINDSEQSSDESSGFSSEQEFYLSDNQSEDDENSETKRSRLDANGTLIVSSLREASSSQTHPLPR